MPSKTNPTMPLTPITAPPTALASLARAHVLLHTYADIAVEAEHGLIAACAIMLYGV